MKTPLTLFSCLSTLFFFAGDLPAQAYLIASADSSGAAAIDSAGWSRITPDGRYVAFESKAGNLASGGSGSHFNVYVKDLTTGSLELVSVSTSGVRGNGDSRFPAISPDGNFVAFFSNADNLVPGDTNFDGDVFVRDRSSGTCERVSVGNGQSGCSGWSGEPAISDDGNFVAFCTGAAMDPLALDPNSEIDVYRRDRASGSTSLVSWTDDFSKARGRSVLPSMSADGATVAYNHHSVGDVIVHRSSPPTNELIASNGVANYVSPYSNCGVRMTPDARLVTFSSYGDYDPAHPNPAPGGLHVFVHDRILGTTELVSLTADGTTAGNGYSPDISADGRFVVFNSGYIFMNPAGVGGIHLRDRVAGTTELVRIPAYWEGTAGGGHNPSISDDGSRVALETKCLGGPPPQSGPGWTYQVLVRQRSGSDRIILTTNNVSTGTGYGYTRRYDWYNAPANAPFWLVYSLERNGATHYGAMFDIGPSFVVGGSGFTDSFGGGLLLNTDALPAGAAGLTVWLEMAVLDGSALVDSNMLMLSIN